MALLSEDINILALDMASPGNRHCADCIGTFVHLSRADSIVVSLHSWTTVR